MILDQDLNSNSIYTKNELYEILELEPNNLRIKQIQKNFRDLIHKCRDNYTLNRLCRAFFVLSVPERKELYDNTERFEISSEYFTLQRSAEEGNISRVKYILNSNCGGINTQDENGHTALYVACRVGRKDIVKWLLKRGADPDFIQRTGSTALHAACFYGHEEIVQLLLDSGANPQIKNNFKLFPFQEIWSYRVNIANKMLKAILKARKSIWVQVASFNFDGKGNIEDFEKQFNEGNVKVNQPLYRNQTLLHCAAKNGSRVLVEWLINQNADVNIADNFRNTPLHIAALYNRSELITLLLNAGSLPNLRNKWGKIPEDESNNNEIINTFKDHKKQDIWKRAECGDLLWFQQYSEVINLNQLQDNTFATPLYLACRGGYITLVKYLVSHKASLHISQNLGSSPLHVATYRGHVEIVEFLLQSGANPFSRNGFGLSSQEEIKHADIPIQKKDFLNKIYKRYTNPSKSNNIYPIHLYDDNNKELKIVINSETTFGHIVTNLDKTYELPLGRNSGGVINQSLNIPFRFSIGSQIIRAYAHSPALQEITKYKNSLSAFVDFPLSLKYTKNTDNVFPSSTPRTRNKLIINDDTKIKASQSVVINKRFCQVVEVTLKGNYPHMDPIKIFFPESTPEMKIQITEYDLDISYPVFQLQTFTESEEGFLMGNLPYIDIPNYNKPWSLYVYDSKSCSFYGLNDLGTPRLPSHCDTYAIVSKAEITPSFKIFPDLLFTKNNEKFPVDESEYKSTAKKDIIIKFKLPEDICISKYDVAYHGTSIEAIESIVTDGLVRPGTMTARGKIIVPPIDHIQRNSPTFGIPDFSDAIFFSPSIYYSSLPIYARPFNYNKKTYLPVLECYVEKGKYEKYSKTTEQYIPRSNENGNELEWRVLDPSAIIVNCLHLREMFHAWQ